MAEESVDMSDVVVRAARREDMAAVAGMIQVGAGGRRGGERRRRGVIELADFEKMPDGPKLSKEDLERDAFECRPPKFRCLVAAGGGGRLVGYAIYFPSYSTWGGAALALEDLYVRPAARRRGLGGRLFDAVAKEAVSSGCCRLDFHVLSWNPARAFYEGRGARDLTAAERWSCFRLEGAALVAASRVIGCTAGGHVDA